MSVLKGFAALALAASVATPALAEESNMARIKIDAGAAYFNSECRRCHATDASHDSYGPLLDHVVGRRAGTFEGYPYSDALAHAGFVWTPEALKAWMADNQAFVPGTKMRHVGITDPVVQEFILEYLKTLTN